MTNTFPSEDWLTVAALMGCFVETPDGTGRLIGCNTPSNGLYVNYLQAKWVVYYGTDITQTWVQREYGTDQIQPII